MALVIAIVVPLVVWTYAKADPELWGIPFFYWYQFLLVIVSVVFGIDLSDNLVYFGLTVLTLNLLVAVIGTLICRALEVDAGTDDTHPTDYLADAGDPEVVDRLDPLSTRRWTHRQRREPPSGSGPPGPWGVRRGRSRHGTHQARRRPAGPSARRRAGCARPRR